MHKHDASHGHCGEFGYIATMWPVPTVGMSSAQSRNASARVRTGCMCPSRRRDKGDNGIRRNAINAKQRRHTLRGRCRRKIEGILLFRISETPRLWYEGFDSPHSHVGVSGGGCVPSTQHLRVELRMEAVLERTTATKCVNIKEKHTFRVSK